MTQHVQTVVIGAGVVGLAIARQLSKFLGHEVLIFESSSIIGSGTSSRNSEVIHAGIYYAKDSLKAKACVEGKQMLYDFAKSYNVGYNNCGKLIVANSSEEVQMLDSIVEKGRQNGVNDLKILNPSDVESIEPECRCMGAILSPSTGIIDSHALMQALQGDAEDAGAMIAFNCSVVGGEILSSTGNGDSPPITQLTFTQKEGSESFQDQITCNNVINAAGLFAPYLASRIVNFPLHSVPKPHFAKGSYFSLEGKSPFGMLVYPVPLKNTAGLGVHATIDMMGRTKFGPDVEWLDSPDSMEWDGSSDIFLEQKAYNVDPERASSFYNEIRKYYPKLKDGTLVADYSGIRPKISGPGEAARDFEIYSPDEHGVAGHVHLYGIESPGLTSSLALAKYVAANKNHFF